MLKPPTNIRIWLFLILVFAMTEAALPLFLGLYGWFAWLVVSTIAIAVTYVTFTLVLNMIEECVADIENFERIVVNRGLLETTSMNKIESEA